MNQIAIFTAPLFWSWIWGVRGMLLAVPMMMAIKVICDHVEPRLELLELTYQSLMRSVALWSTTARHAIDQERECLG
jgi:hypothetical protein